MLVVYKIQKEKKGEEHGETTVYCDAFSRRARE
ncbi:hypothetical protein SAMN05446037_10437 [Anaerovirgula multivorans]|uniref:Uncharacterized protein n=1 Tax=Anaerovirgula multivorans TaxID=312168 RepID=A0A239K5M3_9FIRM|nr:hypothetical protein SAMN05446037_10437 [Anaerovirgula multivorans]